MKTKMKPKEIYISPETDVLKLINEGIICASDEGEGSGEDYTWD